MYDPVRLNPGQYRRLNRKEWIWLAWVMMMALFYFLVLTRFMAWDYIESERVFYPFLWLRHPALHIAVAFCFLISIGIGLWRIDRSKLPVFVIFLTLSCCVVTSSFCTFFWSLTFDPIESIRHNGHVYRLVYGSGMESGMDWNWYVLTVYECDSRGLFCDRVDVIRRFSHNDLPQNPRFAVDETGDLFLQSDDQVPRPIPPEPVNDS